MNRLLAAFVFFFLSISPPLASWHGVPTLAPLSFTGLVATRGKVDGVNLANLHTMVRTGHYARTTVTSLQAILTNFYLNSSNVETANGGATTVHASIEYPSGTCTPFTFSSSASGTIANGSTLLTDALTIAIPNGSLFWVRQFITNSFGFTYQSDNGVKQIDTAGVGDATVTSSATDQTVACGVLTDGGTAGAHAPLAIIGPTTQKSVCLLGDSIAYGSHDVYSGSSGDLGILERSIGPSFAYSNISSGGDAAVTFVGGSTTNRSQIFPYCTSAIVEYGRNDLYPALNNTAAQLETNLTTIYGLFVNPANKGVFQTTLLSDTTSTDSWATTINQSVIGGGPETNRALFNTALRGATFGPASGIFDTNSILGNGSNLSLWNVTGAANFCTNDGVHPSPACYALIQSSGIIPAAAIK